MGNVYFLGCLHSPWEPVPGATSGWLSSPSGQPLSLLSWAFQIIFISSCVLYQLQNGEMTDSEPDDIANH